MSVKTNLYHEYYRGYYDRKVSSLHAGHEQGHTAASITDLTENQWLEIRGADISGGISALNDRLKKCATHKIEGTTTGAGFLADTGYAHQTWIKDKEINDPQMGLSLDFTTGVPYLSGSGLKGLLRSRLWPTGRHKTTPEDRNRQDLNQLLADTLDAEHLGKSRWNKYLFEGYNPEDTKSRLYPKYWVSFLGACVADHSTGKLFQLLHLAPQKTPLKKPIPIPYLSVRPGIKMSVYFSFPEIDEVQESDLEKTLTMMAWHLSESGLGAKQRYGYGRLTDLSATKIEKH